MKKNLLIFLTLAVYFVSTSCSKMEQTNSTSKANNLFDKITQTKEALTITEFSESLLLLNVTGINIISKSDNNIEFKILAGDVVVNESEYVLNNRSFSITKAGEIFTIKGTGCSTYLIYDFVKKDFFINLNDQKTNIKDLEQEPPIQISSDFTVLMIVLNEFVNENLVPGFAPKLKCRGTGVGFHLNQADANYFCKLDLDAILAAHPGWFSPGVTVSCVFEGLFCICTANFYSTN
jgi:hypothetical protein